MPRRLIAWRTALLAWRDAFVDALIPPRCVACDAASIGALCPPCRDAVLPPPRGTIAAAACFGGPVAQAIRAAKFGNDAVIAASLGRLWCERLDEGSAVPLPNVSGIAFVPAHWRRRLARGFDLPAILAGHLARHLGVPVVDALVARRHDPPLSFGADRGDRAVAVQGRFGCRRDHSATLVGRRLLLIDDVHTTGATLAEAGRVLTHAGADVTPAAFAVVP